MPNPTLLDIAIINGSDAAVGLIEETIKAVPEVLRGAARTIKGTQYKTLVRTNLPTTGFRNANEGSPASKSTYANRLYETYIMNPQWNCDKAVADSHEDGAAAFIAMEAQGIMESAFQTLGTQFYYGSASIGDAKGFPGLLAAVDSSMVIDAAGTTDNIASSVWAVRFGPRDVQWVYGENGQIALTPVREQTLFDALSQPYDGYVQSILTRPGLQVARKYSIGRIKKLTTDSGKGLTDNLISQLLAKFKVGMPPDFLFMSRRSLQQLQASRTATNPTGAPAPIPNEAFSIPILPTESIIDTETLAL
jgi:Major capsid protein GP7